MLLDVRAGLQLVPTPIHPSCIHQLKRLQKFITTHPSPTHLACSLHSG
jgi:hypothetical protein